MPTNGMTFIFIDSACFLYSVDEIFPSVTLNFQGGASMILKAEDYLLQQVSIVSSTLLFWSSVKTSVFRNQVGVGPAGRTGLNRNCPSAVWFNQNCVYPVKLCEPCGPTA